MNRIEHLMGQSIESLPTAFSPSRSGGTTAATIGRARRDFSLFSPLHYEPGYAYPLLVWLHGRDDQPQHVNRIMPHVSTRNYVAVAPRISYSSDTVHDIESEAIERSEQQVFESIEHASRRYHVAPHRVFLVGWSDGGSLALRLALRYPGHFAGAASLGGAFPQGDRPLCWLDDARGLPLLLSYGRESQNYRDADVCRDLRLFHSAGLNVTIRQYPGGEDLCTEMLADLNRWTMDLVCASQSESPA